MEDLEASLDFDTFVSEFQHTFYNLAYSYVQNEADAEDLCQEIFLKLYMKQTKFRHQCKLSTWSYRIAVNTCLDFLRKQKRRPQRAELDAARALSPPSQEPESRLVREDTASHVRRLVTQLPAKYRDVIILYHFLQLSYEEIAKALELPLRTVETRLYRGRNKLKEQMIREMGGDDLAVQQVQNLNP